MPPRPSAPKGRSKAEQRAETLEEILDAAEYLFSKRGLYGVTIKDVAQQVGVHTSLLHYYFGDKQAMFDAVIDRRAQVTIDRRMQSMAAYEAACSGKPTVEGAMRAYLEPDLDLYLSGDEGWRNYAALGAQISNTPEGGAVFDEHFDNVVLRLIGLLRQALPGSTDEDLFWGYNFVSGALMLVLGRTGRIDRLSGGLCRSDDLEAIKAQMVTFTAGGFLNAYETRRRQREAAAND